MRICTTKITYDHQGDGRIRVRLSSMGGLIAAHRDDPRLEQDDGAKTARLFQLAMKIPDVEDVFTETDGALRRTCIIVVTWDGHGLCEATKVGKRLWSSTVLAVGTCQPDPMPFWAVEEAIQAAA